VAERENRQSGAADPGRVGHPFHSGAAAVADEHAVDPGAPLALGIGNGAATLATDGRSVRIRGRLSRRGQQHGRRLKSELPVPDHRLHAGPAGKFAGQDKAAERRLEQTLDGAVEMA
jgi:hypothetical protein